MRTATDAGGLADAGSARRVPRGARMLAIRLCAGAVLLAAGCYAVNELWQHPASRMVEGDWPDSVHYTWWLGWTAHALAHGQNPLVTDAMNWPQGVSAMNNTTLLLPATLLAPVTALAGPLVSLNLLNLLAVPLCGLAAYWAARQLDLVRPAAAVAAAAFAFSPAVVNSLVGHITMALAPGLPVLVGLSVQAWRGTRPVRTGVLLGLAAAAQLFTGEEVLFQAGFGAVLVLLVVGLSRPRAVPAAARRLALALGSAVAAFLPLTAYPLYLQFLGPLRQHGSPFLADYYSADLTGFVTPTFRVWLRGAASIARSERFPGGVEEHLAYLGWPLILTCLAVALWRWRDLRVRAAATGLAVAAALSLGGRIWVAGVQTEAHGPYRLLQSAPVADASLATRFGLLAALFAAALLGLAVDGLCRRPPAGGYRWALAAALLAASCLVPLLPRPVRSMPAPQVPDWFTAGSAPSAAAGTAGSARPVVLVLPYPTAVTPVPMYWQARGGYRFAMPGGYFLGPGTDGHAYVGGPADPPTAVLLQGVAQTGRPVAVAAGPRAQARQDLTAWGVGAIVLGPDGAGEALRQVVSALVGAQPQVSGGCYVWTDPFGAGE